MKAIDREQQAEIEIGHTTFSRGVAVFLTVLLLVVIYGLFAVERLQSDGVALVDDVLHLAPTPGDVSDVVSREGAYEGFFTLNRTMLGNMERLTADLEQSSPLRRALVAPANRLLTGKLGAQNADVARGQGGWLFYLPAVAHVTGPAFLSQRTPRRGDPVEALTRFSDQLGERGITLVAMPIPAKVSIYPERLAPGCSPSLALQNPSHEIFLAALKERGVLVCDVTSSLLDLKPTVTTYLARDSHWTPEGMHGAAQQLCDVLHAAIPDLPTGSTAFRAAPVRTIEHAGDLAVMLTPEGQVPGSMTETIQHQAVEGPDGQPWAPDPAAKILLLGDSFCNIFEMEGMGWGAHGGLAAWMSLLLQEPVDAITQNGDGAHATRLRLDQALQRGDDRLAGKRVVVFAFAARELSLGDWKPELKLPAAHAG